MLNVNQTTISTPNNISDILTKYWNLTYAMKAYGGWDVIQDSVFRPSDLFVGCAISGRPNPFDKAYTDLFNNGMKEDIENALMKIPVKSNLRHFNLHSSDARNIEELLLAFTKIRGIKLPIATKILHKKRPNLIPILDSYVIEHYWGHVYRNFFPITRTMTFEKSTLGLFELIKTDLIENYQILIEGKKLFKVKNNINNALINSLTPLRVLDIIIWTTSSNLR